MSAMHYECLECGELVPEGCCTCGAHRKLRLLDITCEFIDNPYTRARWDRLVNNTRLFPKSLSVRQAILAADQYIKLLESALQGMKSDE